jgi:catechol 2,3-dioxygenase-like lactoylglutathione lyase family enzyme
MLTGLWTIGIKVPDLERELAFHRSLGNSIVLDETLELEGERYRIPLVRMGDKYVHLAEKMVYERLLGQALPFGIAHVVYRSDSFDEDVKRALASDANLIGDVTTVSAGFGERRVAFFRAPSGWIFEIIEILKNLVPEV